MFEKGDVKRNIVNFGLEAKLQQQQQQQNSLKTTKNCRETDLGRIKNKNKKR